VFSSFYKIKNETNNTKYFIHYLIKHQQKMPYNTRSKTRFNITCRDYITDINVKRRDGLHKQIEILNILFKFIAENKIIYDLPEYLGFREVTIRKVLYIYNNVNNARELSNNWHIWLTGRPIKI
jgi:hypothetical protein